MVDAHSCLNVLCILLTITHFFLHVLSSSDAAGFSAKLIHRDSPESPLHDPASTPFSRIHAAINRSASRSRHLRHGPSLNSDSLHHLNVHGLSTSLIQYDFEYLMSFGIGSKMMNAWTIMDTGSMLIWVLCYPCHHCYQHEHNIFHPNSSISYDKVHCPSHHCSLAPKHSCDGHNKCKYAEEYFDNSVIYGFLSTETLWFHSAASNKIVYVKNIIIGCTDHTNGSFGKGGIGIFGLNRGELSLVSQLGHYYDRSFSYCPPMVGKSSTFYFGSTGKVSGPGVVTADLLSGIDSAFYKLILETIIVVGAEDEPIFVSPPQGIEATKQVGNIIIDSGTMITYINQQPMNDLLKVLKKKIPIPPTPHSHLDLCYHISEGMNEVVPDIKFQFVGPAVLTLTRKNTFIKIDDLFCLAIKSNDHNSTFSTLGIHLLLNYRIGFDLDANKLSFREEDCSS